MRPYMGIFLTTKGTPIGPYRRFLRGAWGDGVFLWARYLCRRKSIRLEHVAVHAICEDRCLSSTPSDHRGQVTRDPAHQSSGFYLLPQTPDWHDRRTRPFCGYHAECAALTFSRLAAPRAGANGQFNAADDPSPTVLGGIVSPTVHLAAAGVLVPRMRGRESIAMDRIAVVIHSDG